MTKDPREVSPLSRRVILSEDSIPIRPITGRHSLSPSSSTRRPIGDRLAAGLPGREDDGLTTFRGRIPGGLGSVGPISEMESVSINRTAARLVAGQGMT